MPSQCTYRCVVLPDCLIAPTPGMTGSGLNAPTGAWCSLTMIFYAGRISITVSMHLQVRGAP